EQVDVGARESTAGVMLRPGARPDPHAQARWGEPAAAPPLGEITAPTPVIVAQHEQPRLHALADLLASEVPGARREVVPDAGHHPNMEHPELFDDLVLSFLRTVPSSGVR